MPRLSPIKPKCFGINKHNSSYIDISDQPNISLVLKIRGKVIRSSSHPDYHWLKLLIKYVGLLNNNSKIDQLNVFQSPTDSVRYNRCNRTNNLYKFYLDLEKIIRSKKITDYPCYRHFMLFAYNNSTIQYDYISLEIFCTDSYSMCDNVPLEAKDVKALKSIIDKIKLDKIDLS